MVVGARSYETSDSSGQLRLFKYNSTSELWEQLGTGIDGEVSSFLGYAVSLSSDGSIATVGSPFLAVSSNPGRVGVYSFDQILSTETPLIQHTNLYPNPAKDQFNIQLNDGIEFERVRVYNHIGQLIIESKESNINTNNWSQGIYFVEVTTQQGRSIKKLIIE